MKKVYIFVLALASCAGNDGTEDFAVNDAGLDSIQDVHTTDAASCNANLCAVPVNGLSACCTTNNVCGYKAGQVGICYSNDNDAGDSSGSGGANP